MSTTTPIGIPFLILEIKETFFALKKIGLLDEIISKKAANLTSIFKVISFCTR